MPVVLVHIIKQQFTQNTIQVLERAYTEIEIQNALGTQLTGYVPIVL